MAKVLRCRDLGMNCSKEIRAEDEEALLKLAAEHAEKDHGIGASSIPPSTLAMVEAAIRNEPSSRSSRLCPPVATAQGILLRAGPRSGVGAKRPAMKERKC